MQCFNCDKELVHKPFHIRNKQIACEICEICNSFFISRDSINKLGFKADDILIIASDMPAVGKSEICPKCDVSMSKVKFESIENIVIDRCGKCGGLWMDGGDIEVFALEQNGQFPSEWGAFSDFLNDIHVLCWEREKRIRKKIESSEDCCPMDNAKLTGDTDNACPACNAPLKHYKSYGIDLEGCAKCGGMWLEKNELKHLKDRATSGLWTTLRWMDDEIESIENAVARVSNRDCPTCKQVKLVTTCLKGTGILVDCCHICHGVWLDADEFNAIVQHLRKQLLGEFSTDDMRKKVYEEIKEIWSGSENVISEIIDAKAAISALLNISIYNHPSLAKLMLGLGSIRIP